MSMFGTRALSMAARYSVAQTAWFWSPEDGLRSIGLDAGPRADRTNVFPEPAWRRFHSRVVRVVWGLLGLGLRAKTRFPGLPVGCACCCPRRRSASQRQLAADHTAPTGDGRGRLPDRPTVSSRPVFRAGSFAEG